MTAPPPASLYFDAAEVRSDLRQTTRLGGIWTLGAQGATVAVTILGTILLARLLLPQDLGIVGMVTAISGLSMVLADAALVAVVQHPSLTHRQASNAFWLSVLAGVVCGAALALLAPWVGWFYREDRVVDVTRALAIGFLPSCLQVVPSGLLRRGLQFRTIAAVQVAWCGTHYGGMVLWAWCWPSYWAIVWGQLAGQFVRCAATFLACGWQPGLPRQGVGTGGLVGNSLNLTGYRLGQYLTRNLDNLLIGWRWGPAQLGYYRQAYSLMTVPLTQLNAPLSTLAIPVLSRLAGEHTAYRTAFLRILDLIVLLVASLAALALFCGDWVVIVLLGERWRPAAPMLMALGVGLLADPLLNAATWLLASQGRTRELFWWGCVSSCVTILSFAIGLPYGAAGVAWSYSIATAGLLLPGITWLVGRRGPVDARSWWRELALFAPSALLLAAGLAGGRSLAPGEGGLGHLLAAALAAVLLSLCGLCLTRGGRSRLHWWLDYLSGRIRGGN